MTTILLYLWAASWWAEFSALPKGDIYVSRARIELVLAWRYQDPAWKIPVQQIRASMVKSGWTFVPVDVDWWNQLRDAR